MMYQKLHNRHVRQVNQLIKKQLMRSILILFKQIYDFHVFSYWQFIK